MGVADAGNIFRRGVEFHCHHRLGDQLGGVVAEHVNAENAVGCGARNHFHEARGIALPQGTAVGGKGNLSNVY